MMEDGWIEYRKLILSELESLNRDVKDIKRDIGTIKTEIAMLKVKSGLWGFAAGAIPAALAVILTTLSGCM